MGFFFLTAISLGNCHEFAGASAQLHLHFFSDSSIKDE